MSYFWSINLIPFCSAKGLSITMSQIKHITNTLKALLKQHKITYKELAKQLDMSEANVKRVFSTQTFTLERLEQVCHVMNINLSDLFLLAEKQQDQLTELTEEQEQQLVDDLKLILVAVCVRDGWSYAEIIEHYQIDRFECTRLMAKLDKLKMIQLLPNNQYKLLIAQDFRWRKKGPLERFMQQQVLTQFMQTNFEGEDCFRFYLRGSYSDASIVTIQRKLNQVTKEVALLNQEDAQLPLSQRKHIGLLMAMRPWELPQFAKLRR